MGFKTTPTVVWCADHTALCGPHPHSRLRNYPTTTISPQYILTFFIKFLEKKIFKKRFQEFFFKILKKSIQMNCGGGVRVRTTPHLKKLWLCGPHNHTKTQCGLDPYLFSNRPFGSNNLMNLYIVSIVNLSFYLKYLPTIETPLLESISVV